MAGVLTAAGAVAVAAVVTEPPGGEVRPSGSALAGDVLGGLEIVREEATGTLLPRRDQLDAASGWGRSGDVHVALGLGMEEATRTLPLRRGREQATRTLPLRRGMEEATRTLPLRRGMEEATRTLPLRMFGGWRFRGRKRGLLVG